MSTKKDWIMEAQTIGHFVLSVLAAAWSDVERILTAMGWTYDIVLGGWSHAKDKGPYTTAEVLKIVADEIESLEPY